MRIDRPIFLLGPGRSGSTLLNQLLTWHRDVGYFTSWSNKYPRLWMLAAGSRLRSWRLERTGRRIRYYPGPTEAYGIWKHCFRDFWRQCRRPCDDPTGAARARYLVERHLWVQGRSRFLAKLTGPPMFRFFRSIFPDARFVWVDRDPRAVVLSYSKGRKVSVPPGMEGAEAEERKLRQSAQRYLEIYQSYRRSSETSRLLIYGDFVQNPEAETRRLLDDLELPADRRLLHIVRSWKIRDADDKWRRELDAPRRDLLCRLLEEPLRDRGLIDAGRGE